MPRKRRSETGRRGPYNFPPARRWKGKLLSSSEAAIHARLEADWRERIRLAARRRFHAQAYHIGLYKELARWVLVVTPRTQDAATRLGGSKGEDVRFRVQFDEHAGYTFHPYHSTP